MYLQRLVLHAVVVGCWVLLLWASGQASLIFVLPALALSAALILTAESKGKALSTATFIWLGGVILTALMLPLISSAGPRAYQAQCKNNLKQISNVGCARNASRTDLQVRPCIFTCVIPWTDLEIHPTRRAPCVHPLGLDSHSISLICSAMCQSKLRRCFRLRSA